MLPKVAIICANYNYENFIVAAMNSIRNQTYEGEISLFVVDDGSSDNSWDKISEYYRLANGESPWLYIKKIENSGASVARNVAIQMCHGWADIIGVLDADDAYHPEKVEKLVNKLVEHDEIGVAYADYENVYPDYSNREFKPHYSFVGLRKSCMVHSNALIKKKYLDMVRLPSPSIFRAYNGEFFDSRLHGPASKGFIGCTEDYDLWLRLSRVCMFCHVPECLAIANIHGNNQSLKMTAEIFMEQSKILGTR